MYNNPSNLSLKFIVRVDVYSMTFSSLTTIVKIMVCKNSFGNYIFIAYSRQNLKTSLINLCKL